MHDTFLQPGHRDVKNPKSFRLSRGIQYISDFLTTHLICGGLEVRIGEKHTKLPHFRMHILLTYLLRNKEVNLLKDKKVTGVVGIKNTVAGLHWL